MGKLENQWLSSSSRRTALRSLVSTFAGARYCEDNKTRSGITAVFQRCRSW
jgi:hypothetical protein